MCSLLTGADTKRGEFSGSGPFLADIHGFCKGEMSEKIEIKHFF